MAHKNVENKLLVSLFLTLLCVSTLLVFIFLSFVQKINPISILNTAQASGINNENIKFQEVQTTKQGQTQKDTVIVNPNLQQPTRGIKPILQSKALTCELASLEMALSYYNIFVDEIELLEQVGFADPRKSFMIGDQLYWADPDIGFVGEPDGKVWTKDKGLLGASGFGVNAGPVLKVAKKYRPQSYQPANPSLENLRKEIDLGRPILFWHVPKVNNYMGKTSYLTPRNKKITLVGEHANLMVGYYKSQETFRYIFLDPIFGKIDLDELETQQIWDAYYRMSLVIA